MRVLSTAPCGAVAYSGAPPGRPSAEGAELVSSKTTGPSCLDVGFAPHLVRERRVKRLRRQVWAGGHLHRLGAPPGGRDHVFLVTLTYRGVDDWHPGHISACMKQVRRWCQRRGIRCRYLWVAELQQRGALHYHIALWLPRRIQLPKFDKQGWWPHGWTHRTQASNAVGYLMKYLSKISPFHVFPKGARLYGIGGLTTEARDICSWLNLPSYLKQQFGVGELRTAAGRRVVRETGEVLAAMYRRVFHLAGMRLYSNGPIPERWADGPYSALRPHLAESPP